MNYQLCTNVKDCKIKRESFFELAKLVFGIDFAPWYAEGYWTEQYKPYTLFDGDRAVANVSVNQMRLNYQGKERNYIQLGTVMTHPDYRGQGLSGFLLTKVLEEYREACDSIYLFANHKVLDYYPKFGFEAAPQYNHSFSVQCGRSTTKKLNLQNPTHKELFFGYLNKKQPHTAFPMLGNRELLMFTCMELHKEHIFFLEEEQAIAIAEQNGDTLHCMAIYGGEGYPLSQILSALADEATRKVTLGFTPLDSVGSMVRIIADNKDQLFFLGGKENLFYVNQLLFPVLSHA